MAGWLSNTVSGAARAVPGIFRGGEAAGAAASRLMAGSSATAAQVAGAGLTGQGLMAAGAGAAGIYGASSMAAQTISGVTEGEQGQVGSLSSEITFPLKTKLGLGYMTEDTFDLTGGTLPTNPEYEGIGTASRAGAIGLGGAIGGAIGMNSGNLEKMTPFDVRGLQSEMGKGTFRIGRLGDNPFNAGKNIGLARSSRNSTFGRALQQGSLSKNSSPSLLRRSLSGGMTGRQRLGAAFGNRVIRGLQSKTAFTTAGFAFGMAAGEMLYESTVGTAADAVREVQAQVADRPRGGPSVRRGSSAGANVTRGRAAPQANGRMALQLAKTGGKGPVMT